MTHLYSVGSPPFRSQDLFFEGSCAHVFVFFCGACICEGKVESLQSNPACFQLLALMPCLGSVCDYRSRLLSALMACLGFSCAIVATRVSVH